MKTISTFLLVALMLACSVARSQDNLSSATDSTGLPGDHFSLQGALEMFKTSKSLEEFEKKLNTESNYVNNLDLDDDGKTDYITVSDKMEGTSHAIILRVHVSEKESQDVAVIGIEKSGNEAARLQIIGDEILYGDSTIIEPVEVSTEGGKGGVGGPSPMVVKQSFFFVNVWYWPCIMFLYTPVYTPWYSPWYYGYYPYWYSPWHHQPWYYHHHHCHHWHSYYHHSHHYNMHHAHGIYGNYRKTSPTVEKKFAPAHLAYKGNKANTVSQPKPIGPVKPTNVNNQGKGNPVQGKANIPVKPNPKNGSDGYQGKGSPNTLAIPSTSPVKPSPRGKNGANDSYQGKGNTTPKQSNINTYQGKGNTTPKQNNTNTYQGKGNSAPKQVNTNNSYQGKGNSNQGKSGGYSSPKSNSSPRSNSSMGRGSSGGKRGR